MEKVLSKFFFTFLSIGVSLSVLGQENITLKIGDAAPPFKYSKWIKGSPVTSLTGDQIFVVEFWATWCGPCKMAMPHLTRLQKEYEGKITIIGVDIWEDVKKGMPYDVYLPKVE